jgi:BirA family transcriptional regulator, biotin operon repressor / biotin---[acetyl-CoA-carboxylase] ligase
MVPSMIEPSTTTWQRAARPGRRIGHVLEAHDRIGSTNDRARQLLDAGVDGVVVVAEEQTAGRGRRGRSWLSPPGRNLTFSVALRPRLASDGAWQLGLGAAVAARDACAEHAAVGLKWPNDLVALDTGGKLGGLLVETAIERDVVVGAVIGLGLNVNWRPDEMPVELPADATSLAAIAGREIDRVALLARLLEALERELDGLETGVSPLDRYRSACVTLGAHVRVETGRGPMEGRAVDLDERGCLVVETADGWRTLTTGDVMHLRARGSGG